MPDPFLRAAAVAVVALAALSDPARPSRRRDAVVVLAVCALAVAHLVPLLPIPLDHDAQTYRIAFARHDPFGDWNHPFLSYALNLPARWSSDPVVVRLVPAFWAVAVAAGLVALGARLVDRTAGALAGAWFAFEIPRRTAAVWELGDWDLAGLFLLGTVAWLHHPPERPIERAVTATLLAAAAFCSSYLAFVGAGLLFVERLIAARGRPRPDVLGTGAVIAVAAPWLAHVFRLGTGARDDDIGGVRRLWPLVREVLAEWPTGRTAAMEPVLVLGVLWLLVGVGVPWRRWSLATVAGTLAALVVAAARSHVNGGYYAGLVTPLLLLAGGCAVVDVLRRLGDGRAARAVRGLLVVGVAVLTTGDDPGGRAPYGPSQDHLALEALAVAVHGDDRPLVTSLHGVDGDVLHVWDRHGWPGFEGLLTRTSPLHARYRRIRCVDCRRDPDCAAALEDGWVLFTTRGVDEEERACAEALEARCTPVEPDGVRFYGALPLDCRPS